MKRSRLSRKGSSRVKVVTVAGSFDYKKNRLDVLPIKRKALENYDYIYLVYDDGGHEAVIVPKMFGKNWWRKATASDIRRVSVG